MATVNGKQDLKGLENYTHADIGNMLLDASPTKDGAGIVVNFTEFEERLIRGRFGISVEDFLSTTLCDAIKTRNLNANAIRFTCAARTFKTEKFSPVTEPVGARGLVQVQGSLDCEEGAIVRL